jgi:Glutathione peroxidase
MGVYDYQVKDAAGKDVSLGAYAGKTLLIVNTATHCGFTPQYAGLEKLYEAYRDRGLEILDFPCNQFASQAPESNEGIQQFCQLRYHTTFPRFSKIEVNGPNEAPLYAYLKGQRGGVLNGSIKWNFTKFLINPKGEVVRRYAPTKTPDAIAKDIEGLLEEKEN